MTVPPRSERTRDRLMAAMAQGLRERGYAATGLRELLAATGIPKGSLYHHFPRGKEALAGAALGRAGDAIEARLRGLAETAGDPVAAVRSFCDDYARALESSRFRQGCPLATVALEAAPDVDEVHQPCKSAFARIETVLTEMLTAEGLQPEPASALALTILASIEGALILAKAERSVRPLLGVRDSLTQQIRAALEAARGSHPS